MSNNKVIVIKIYLTYFAFTAYYQSAMGILILPFEKYEHNICLLSTELSMIMSSTKLNHGNIVMINNF